MVEDPGTSAEKSTLDQPNENIINSESDPSNVEGRTRTNLKIKMFSSQAERENNRTMVKPNPKRQSSDFRGLNLNLRNTYVPKTEKLGLRITTAIPSRLSLPKSINKLGEDQ